MQQILTERFFLSAGDANAQGEMSLPLLVAKFIDLATAHANSLHYGNPDMAHLQAGWVLSRIALQIDSYPRANEQYSVSTWVEKWTHRFSVRCFMVADADGRPLGYARSVWMILSTVTHESLPLTIFDFNPDVLVPDKCPAINSQKHRPIETPDSEPVHYTFQYTDLDFYRHVNTVRYVSLLLNQFTLAQMDAARVSRLEISFMHEGCYGDRIEIRSQSDSPLSKSLSLVTADARDILFARILLTPRNPK